MLPAVIEYILSLRNSANMPGIYNRAFQVAIPNFPPLNTINYSVSPSVGIHAYIIYELSFGQAMVPHAFDVKVYHGGQKLLDSVISGRFTVGSFNTFLVVGESSPANFSVTNLRTLVNYYESTAFYINVPDEEHYAVIVDALKRLHTSVKSEELASQSNNLLSQLVALEGGTPAPFPPVGGIR